MKIFSGISQNFNTKFYVLWIQTSKNLKSIKFANNKLMDKNIL